MSKKDYVRIATAFARTRPPIIFSIENDTQYHQWRKDVEEIAYELHRENLAFDRSRFLTACGI